MKTQTTFVQAMETLNRRSADAQARMAAHAVRMAREHPNPGIAEIVHQGSLRLMVLSQSIDDQALADALHEIAHELMRSQ